MKCPLFANHMVLVETGGSGAFLVETGGSRAFLANPRKICVGGKGANHASKPKQTVLKNQGVVYFLKAYWENTIQDVICIGFDDVSQNYFPLGSDG